MMKRQFTFVTTLILIICLFCSCSSGNTRKVDSSQSEKNRRNEIKRMASFKTYTLPELQEDFQQVKKIIGTEHPKLFANQKELDEMLEKQYTLLKDSMDELEFNKILSPIVSKLNCGHTSLNFSKEFEEYAKKNGKYMPLSIKVLEDKAYICQNFASEPVPVGGEIVDINGKGIKEIINIFLENISADGYNTSRKFYIMNQWFSEMYLSYVDAPEDFNITVIDPGNQKELKIRVTAINKEELDSARKETNGTEGKEEPTYSGKFEKDYAVLSVKTFAFYEEDQRNQFKKYIDAFFSDVKGKGISELVLDLRDNWGGDPYATAHLYSYLINKASPYFTDGTPFYTDLAQPVVPSPNRFKGKLFVLTNGASFSSTGHLCALLKFHKTGTFIGEETGGSFVCTDGSGDIILKNTKIRFHYSMMKFEAAVSGMTQGRGIMPDYPVVPTIGECIRQKDLAMEMAVELIHKENK